jgi:hypothetical protein
VPLMQATHLIAPAQLAPTLKPGNFGLPKEGTIKIGDTVAPIQGGKLGIALGDKPKVDNGFGKLDTVGKVGTIGKLDTIGKTETVGKVVTMPGITPKTDTTATDPKKIVTLPAPVTTGTATTGGGKIVTMPATTVGKATSNPVGQTGSNPVGKIGSAPDVKTTFPAKRIVDVPAKPQFQVQRRETVMPKLNANPQQTGRSSVGRFSSMGGGSSFAQSGSQGRRGFMR